MAEAYPWQDSLWQQLAGREQHAHAYLLHGPAGIGKRALAERLMARLLCQSPVGLDACGQCKSCLLLAAGSHPDNYNLEPEEADKPIKVDQVRDPVSFVAQGVREQRAAVVDGVKKLLKREASATQLAEGWNAIPLLLLFDWFCDWSSLILRYQLTEDETGLGLEDMRKVLQYLAQKTPQDKVLAIQDWILAQRQKVLGKANLNRVLLLEALLVQWASLPGQR